MELVKAPQPKVAYIIKCFPRLSETFILHEVLELEQQGMPLHIFSLLPATGKINRAAQDVRSQITYVPHLFWRGLPTFLPCAIRRFRKTPWVMLSVCLATLIRLHHPSMFRKVFQATYIAEQLEQEGITHLHAHYANTPTTLAFIIHELTGIPYSFTAHAKDIYLSEKWVLAYRIRHARFVVTCTDYNWHYLENVSETPLYTPIYRIYHGLDLCTFPAEVPTERAASNSPLILCVARLVEKKGLPYLLAACHLLKKQGYVFRCRIIGEGPLRPQLEQRISELALNECVELCGEQTHEQVIATYRQATLKVLPCIIGENGDRDGIPNVLVEALYMGVPVVSTPISGIPELITSEVNGLLVESRDSDALASAIARLFDDAMLRQRLAQAGRQTVLEHFVMERNARLLKQLFNTQMAPFQLQAV